LELFLSKYNNYGAAGDVQVGLAQLNNDRI